MGDNKTNYLIQLYTPNINLRPLINQNKKRQ